MALDKSKENSRIADFINMHPDAQFYRILSNIKNPAILKHFMDDSENSSYTFSYAMAAGILDRNDVEWIKEQDEDLIPGSDTPKDDSGEK